MPRREDGALFAVEAVKPDTDWTYRTGHIDAVVGDLEDELEKAEVGDTLTFTVTVVEP